MPYFILSFLIIIFLLINTYYVKVTTNEINDFRFIHISDLHGTIRFLNGSLCNIINRLNPDFIVVTGDLSNTRKQLPKVLDNISKVTVKSGKV